MDESYSVIFVLYSLFSIVIVQFPEDDKDTKIKTSGTIQNDDVKSKSEEDENEGVI